MRTFDVILDCGCMISSDNGGGLIPCCYPGSTKKEMEKCDRAWKKYIKSKKYKEHEIEKKRKINKVKTHKNNEVTIKK